MSKKISVLQGYILSAAKLKPSHDGCKKSVLAKGIGTVRIRWLYLYSCHKLKRAVTLWFVSSICYAHLWQVLCGRYKLWFNCRDIPSWARNGGLKWWKLNFLDDWCLWFLSNLAVATDRELAMLSAKFACCYKWRWTVNRYKTHNSTTCQKIICILTYQRWGKNKYSKLSSWWSSW